jgi:replicative DNA helicase
LAIQFTGARAMQQDTRKPKALAGVYGSRWLTAGMGSVVCVWGDAGDLVVELTHLTQPVEQVGPMLVVHDHERGSSTVHEQVDLEQLLKNAGGLTTGADQTQSPPITTLPRRERG